MSKLLDQYFSLIRRFIPVKTIPPAVGIDIATSDCKLIEIVSKDNQCVLNHWDSISLGDDPSASVKAIVDGLETPPRAPIIAVFGKGLLIRYVELPRMPLEDLRKSFDIEADKYFPFSQDQIYTDCHILDPDGKSKKMMVMGAAARRELVDQRVELLKKNGLNVTMVGVNSVALINVLNRFGVKNLDESSEPVALLDMGESVSSVSIMIDHVPWFTREIFIGGRDVTRKIQASLGISFKEAEELKKDSTQHHDVVSSACEFVMMTILQEVRLSFDYFTTERNREVKQLLLTGGGSLLRGVTEVFEKNMEIPVLAWNPFENVVIPPALKDEFELVAPRFGVALGLALGDYD
jgi:type IV pilus assembly protein PilM